MFLYHLGIRIKHLQTIKKNREVGWRDGEQGEEKAQKSKDIIRLDQRFMSLRTWFSSVFSGSACGIGSHTFSSFRKIAKFHCSAKLYEHFLYLLQGKEEKEETTRIILFVWWISLHRWLDLKKKKKKPNARKKIKVVGLRNGDPRHSSLMEGCWNKIKGEGWAEKADVILGTR